jgi:hypothetical protein
VIVAAGDDCSASASVDDGSFSADGSTIILTQTPAGPYLIGTNSVTLTVTDSQGATDSCSARVIVQDATPPQLTCPTSIAADATSPTGAVVAFAPTAADACSGPPMVRCVPPSGSTFPIGVTWVVCTALDRAGNSASCQFQVRVLGPRQMLQRLLDLVNSQWTRPQPLTASLDAALASLDRNNSISAINQLQAFENKVRAQVAPSASRLAQSLIRSAENIAGALGPSAKSVTP